jgi:hypothetical protein
LLLFLPASVTAALVWRDISFSSFFCLHLLSPMRDQLEIMLSLTNCNIAGAVPTVSWLQVVESEARQAARVAGCPFWTIRAAHMRAEVNIR